MSEIVVHPLTRRQLDAFVQAPGQAVMLVGPSGSGKLSLATRLAESVLQLPENSFGSYSYGRIVSPAEGKAIGIESARELEHFLSLRVPGKSVPNRVIIIEDSHLLTPEAQNALLKTLEEPPAGTIIILTARHSQALLPTIRSRTQSIDVHKPEQAALTRHFAARFGEADIRRAYAISGGLPGLMHALLDEEEHQLLAATEQARQLLSRPAYERLLMVDELSKQKDLANDTVYILQQMAHVSLAAATGKAAARWKAVLEASYTASEALHNSGQPKLVLTNMMLQF